MSRDEGTSKVALEWVQGLLLLLKNPPPKKKIKIKIINTHTHTNIFFRMRGILGLFCGFLSKS